MQKRLKKRPADVNQLARHLVDLSTQERAEPTTDEVSRVMAALGRKGGKIGGKRRLQTLSAEERSAIALKAADRYATAAELGKDIERWLADERPPPIAYNPFMANHAPSRDTTVLADGWTEEPCVRCGEVLLYRDGDQILIEVNSEGQATGQVCTRCFRRHYAPDGTKRN